MTKAFGPSGQEKTCIACMEGMEQKLNVPHPYPQFKNSFSGSYGRYYIRMT